MLYRIGLVRKRRNKGTGVLARWEGDRQPNFFSSSAKRIHPACGKKKGKRRNIAGKGVKIDRFPIKTTGREKRRGSRGWLKSETNGRLQ